MEEERRRDTADYCRELLDCSMFGCHQESHGNVAAAETVACGTAGWHRDLSVEEGGIEGEWTETLLRDGSWISKHERAHNR
jgi:hypothetical protein